MTEPVNAQAWSTAISTDTSKGTAEVSGRGTILIRLLMVINLALVAIQALSAGFLLSGYELAVTVHTDAAHALQLGAFIQAITAVVLWWRRGVPRWVAGLSVGLFAIVFLQVGLGYHRSYWLHVPIGVGMFGWLMTEVNRLNAFWRTTGTQA